MCLRCKQWTQSDADASSLKTVAATVNSELLLKAYKHCSTCNPLSSCDVHTLWETTNKLTVVSHDLFFITPLPPADYKSTVFFFNFFVPDLWAGVEASSSWCLYLKSVSVECALRGPLTQWSSEHAGALCCSPHFRRSVRKHTSSRLDGGRRHTGSAAVTGINRCSHSQTPLPVARQPYVWRRRLSRN